ncbi:uncharacterized protein EKO05_0005222 [Ascochyta rabiei]|uniref:Uncharacterized protein n=1 Tax=Didymella rabiei TaxID=5454 RepID=A0A163A5P6_DIDRA|nr:uncharacterized protein EKO05_0005222 [Ascochyta rabiei]KZM20999.1 hypothetical protein ST47_g7871 [Ascochyta rabiei]UPX14750.1 hypothetical protein EKO05_0005222 [Ascochyta rabiei]
MKMAPKRISVRTRQTKLGFSPASKSRPANPTPTNAMRSKESRQPKLDVNRIAPKGAPKRARTLDSDSSEDELQVQEKTNLHVGVPVRAKSNGTFGSSDVDSAEESSSEAQSEAEKPAQAKATRSNRKRQRAESSGDEDTVTVVQRKRARQAESGDEDELRVPSKRRRGERRAATPLESEEDVATPPRSTRRRLARRPATPEGEQTPPPSTRRRARRQRASSDEEEEGEEQDEDSGGEHEELQEELAFLRSSPPPDRGRLRSTQGKPKNKRQEALEALKRRRAGSTQEPSSTPARKTRTVIDSDSDSELEVIKEEPDSDEVGDPESEAEDDEEEDDRDANALDMFQEDEDDTGFIDDDPDAIIGEPDDGQPQLPMQFSSMSRAKPKELFKYAVEWMVMKKIHPAFNPHDEIYELTFRKLGDEVKGLASSKFTSSAWTPDFTRAINARPFLAVSEIAGARREFLADHCEACNRRNHPASFELALTGQPYNPDTLEPLEPDSSDSGSDSDSDSDSSSLSASTSPHPISTSRTHDARGDRIPPESKTFTLGSTCSANAQVAHTLHHWRFHLNDWVRDYLSTNGYLAPEKLIKRDRKSDAKRAAEARRIVDKMERKGEIAKLHRQYKDQVKFAVEAVNDFERGWGRR